MFSSLLFSSLLLALIVILYSSNNNQSLFQFTTKIESTTDTNNHIDDNNDVDKNKWSLISIKNGVMSYKKKMPGSKLLAFRGIKFIDLPLHEVMGPFLDLSLAYKWIDMLENITVYSIGTDTNIPAISASPFVVSSSTKDKRENYNNNNNNNNKYNSILKSKSEDEGGRGITTERIKEWFGAVVNKIKNRTPSNSNSIININNDRKMIKSSGDRRKKDIVGEKRDVDGDRDRDRDIIHEVFKLPWPMSKRDILLERQWLYDRENKSVTILYHSVLDDRIPEMPGVVRAESPHTLWRFQDSAAADPSIRHELENAAVIRSRKSSSKSKSNLNFVNGDRNSKKGTILEIECVVDSKGSVPPWFINFVQEQWPSQALSLYEKILRSNAAQPSLRTSNW